jgi:multidrug efflux pump subunit AcrB
VQQQPDIEFPIVIVQIGQPGAAPTEIETQITQRVEAAVRSIPGVESISSTASEGSSSTQVQFQLGEDINASVSEVKNMVDQIRGNLPDGILEPQIFKVNTSSEPIAYFSVTADDMTPEQLSWFIDDTVAKRLLGVEGMADVKREGGVDREILVTLDPQRMQAFGVTAPQVNQALRVLNLNAAGGRAEIGGTRQSMRVLANAHDAYALSQTQVALGGNRYVKLTDIATVQDSFGEIKSLAKVGGKSVVLFSISRARGLRTCRCTTMRSRTSPRSRPRTRASISRCSSPRSITPRTSMTARCPPWSRARCWRLSWCSSSCATGARRWCRRWRFPCPRSPPSGA